MLQKLVITYYITNDLIVDRARRIILADNGEDADACVRLCCAPGIDSCAGITIYYADTNGDPIAFLDGQPEQNLAICYELKRTPDALLADIKAAPAPYGDEASRDWMIEQLESLCADGVPLREIMGQHREDFCWLREHRHFNDRDWNLDGTWYAVISGPDTMLFGPDARITLSGSEPIVETW